MVHLVTITSRAPAKGYLRDTKVPLLYMCTQASQTTGRKPLLA